MSAEAIFAIANNGVIPFWLLLVFAPGWKWTQVLVHTFAIPMLLAVLYLYLAVTSFGGGEGNFFSLAGVTAMFSDPYALLAGWVHYLIFDLFVGAWIARDARRHQINHLLVAPCLFFTLMLGPVGLLMYYILRGALRKTFTMEEIVATQPVVV